MLKPFSTPFLNFFLRRTQAAADRRFYRERARPNWKANADLNGDNIVDIYDAILLANHYNQHYP
jgi:hypothetical protein